MRAFIPMLAPGWDLVLIARNQMVTAAYQDVNKAVDELLRRAGLLAPAGEQVEHVR